MSSSVPDPADPAEPLKDYLRGEHKVWFGEPRDDDIVVYPSTSGDYATITVNDEPDGSETLADWLRAAIDRDAEIAEAIRDGAPRDPWSYGDIDSVAGGSLYDADVMIGGVYWDTEPVDPRIRRTRTVEQADAVGHHIARHGPARVLRDVAAKRAILDRELLFDSDGQPQCQGHPGPWMNHGDHGPGYCRDYSDNWTVRLLAQSYRGEPGWREEWAIDES